MDLVIIVLNKNVLSVFSERTFFTFIFYFVHTVYFWRIGLNEFHVGFFIHIEEEVTIIMDDNMEQGVEFFGGEIVDFGLDCVKIVRFKVSHTTSLSFYNISTFHKMLIS